MSVRERLDLFPSFERSADGRDLSGLASIRRLLADLGHPEQGLDVVHVAGSHGKGLTASMIAAILDRDGERTGLYTSPHVRDLRDGIQIEGKWISEEAFARHAAAALDVAESYGGGVTLSRFDLMTAIALMAFSESRVDRAVLEAGLGGRLDSTNVTAKSLAVITPIDYEHTAVLGESLAEIVEHKLGILRADTPVVLAEQEPQVKAILEKKLGRGAGRVLWSDRIRAGPSGPGGCRLEWPDLDVRWVETGSRAARRVYLECLRTALVAREALGPGRRGAGARDRWIEAAMAVSLPGRLEDREDVYWRGGAAPFARIVLDGCHSPGAVRACAEQLAAWRIDGYTLILGVAEDKLTGRMAQPLADLCGRSEEILLTAFDHPRSASPRRLARFLLGTDPLLEDRIRRTGSVGSALARSSERPRRPLVVAGSLYLIRDVLPVLLP